MFKPSRAFLVLVFCVVFGERAGAQMPQVTIVYNNVKYFLSDSSRCAQGEAAISLGGRWWCPLQSAKPSTYTAMISWSVPTQREDGSSLSVKDLSGYEIYYTTDDSSVSGVFKIAGGGVSSYTASNLAAGNYYFSISAIDLSGFKSALSNLVSIRFGP